MAAVAALLRVPAPANFQMSRVAGPEQSSLALLAGVRVPLTQVRPLLGSAGGRQQRPPPPAGTGPRRCSQCKGMLGNGVHGVGELKQVGLGRAGPHSGGTGFKQEVTLRLFQEAPPAPGTRPMFCSLSCSAQYGSDQQNRAAGSKAPVLPTGSEHAPPSRAPHHYANNMSSIAVHSLPLPPSSSSSSSPPLSFPPALAITMETRPRMDSLKVGVVSDKTL